MRTQETSKHHPKPTKAAAYIRVSTDEQATEGQSLESQLSRIKIPPEISCRSILKLCMTAKVDNMQPLNVGDD